MTDFTATNDNPSPPKRPSGGPEARRVVLVLILALTASSALVAAAGWLKFVLLILACLCLRQMIEDEITIGLKRPFESGKNV